MKTSKNFWRLQAIILIVAFFAWINISGNMAASIEMKNKTAEINSTAFKKPNSLNYNSLYYRYWKIIKARSKKHKV